VSVKPIKMNLRENAYDFLNESLRAAVRAESDLTAWKFAVLHIVQAIELLMKARLHDAHPSLLYENVDTPGKTVSLSQAVGRITGAARIPLMPRELRTIRKARQWRDQIVHFEFEMSAYQVTSVYSQLFEFLTRFHNDHTEFGELHAKIDRDMWPKEAELIEFFRREVVLYNGVEVSRDWPGEVMGAQNEKTVMLHGKDFARLHRGTDWPSLSEFPCHDCGIVDGQLHVPMCDMERCPRCFGQLISCGCLWDEGPAESELDPREVAFTRESELLQSIRQELDEPSSS
jgi:HEPN domain-containing protein